MYVVLLEGKEYLKKNNKLKNYFKIIKSPKKPFKERLIFYKQCFEDYKNWRSNFKFPKTTYLARVDKVKPLPSSRLVKNLAISISELREEYLKLKNYKSVLIFKLFLFYFAETFKATYKIKINKSIGGPFSGWASGRRTPTRRDINSLMELIVLHIFKFENSCSDYKYDKKKNDWVRKNHGIVKVPNFKWDKIWRKYSKNYVYQDKFATEDHYRPSGDEKSLSKTNKMIKTYENSIKKSKSKDSYKIVNLFYALTYCKDFKKIDEIFDENLIQKTKSKKDNLNWQRLESEKVSEGKEDFDLDWNLLEQFKKRVFPQFTFKNIKNKFDSSKFLKEVINTKDIKLSIIRAIDADDDLVEGIDYHELLPEYDLILPAYTSGSIFNQLDKDLSFTTVTRFQTVIKGLGESIEKAYGILKTKKNNKYFFIHYHNDREGKTYCDLICELNKNDCLKIPLKNISNEIKKWKSEYDIPDRIVLNKDYKWNFNEIKKVINRSVKQKIKSALEFVDYDPSDKKKRSSAAKEYLDSWREEQEYNEASIGCRIYLLTQKEIDKETNKGRGTGSVRVSLKRGDVSQDSLIERKPYLIFK
jgi:hypothetical protein